MSATVSEVETLLMGDGMDRLSVQNNLFVKQTRRGCLQEAMGCEAKTEFQVSTSEDKNLNLFYAIEEGSCCIRTFCPVIRGWNMNVSVSKDDPVFLQVERPIRCTYSPCKCCCFQEVAAYHYNATEFRENDGRGPLLGRITEAPMNLCVPRFNVTDDMGQETHVIAPPTCMGGQCVDMCAEGFSCRIPFHVEDSTGTKVGNVTKVWAGLAYVR